MGKLATVAIFGSTGTVASLGGAYMLGAFGPSNLDIPIDLKGFKENVGNYFPGALSSSEGETGGTSSKPDTGFLGSSTSEAQGRLVVNWEKLKCASDQGTSGKLTGRIRGLGTFKNENKGLILYASAKAASEDSKLSVDGVIYSLEKETDGWKIKHNKQLSTTPAQVSEFDSKFPNVSDAFKNDLKVKEYWGFTNGTDNLNKLCKWETSHDNSKEFEQEFKGSWAWKPESGKDKKPFDGSKTSHQGLETFYGTPDPTLETLVTSFSGIGSEEYFVNKDLGVTVSEE